MVNDGDHCIGCGFCAQVCPEVAISVYRENENEKILMKGNDAVAEAAIQAGCDLYFGYPITPQTEISEYLSLRMPEEGKIFSKLKAKLPQYIWFMEQRRLEKE